MHEDLVVHLAVDVVKIILLLLHIEKLSIFMKNGEFFVIGLTF